MVIYFGAYNNKQRKTDSVKSAVTAILIPFVFVLSGCVYDNEPTPKIVQSSKSSGPVLVQPSVIEPSWPGRGAVRDVPREWMPPIRLERKWTAIVIHHSATDEGNVDIFDKWHREGNNWEGIGYDFVIGNGTSSGDGEVEVTFRWRRQQTGAHCKTPNNWANESAVGICLVGNFNQQSPTWRQMQSLLKLVRFLQDRYNIPTSRIYGHNTTPGARVTECPGRKFPMARLKSMLGA